jgi:hypothetical protein
MEADALYSGRHKVVNMVPWIADHDVSIEVHCGLHGPQGLDQWRPKGQIGDKVPVHDVQVQPSHTGSPSGSHLGPEIGKIRAQDGWG